MKNDNFEVKELGASDFEIAFKEKLDEYTLSRIKSYNFRYKEISTKEQDELLIRIMEALIDGGLVKAGEHRRSEWDEGWQENFNAINQSDGGLNSIIPGYFNKYNVIRWGGRFIRPVSEHFEKNSLSIITDWMYSKYFRNMSRICEFGCGTGHNLIRARDVNKNAELWGGDWAHSSQRIIEKMRISGIDPKVYGHNFDYFNPDKNFQLPNNTGVVTIASLEQVGDRWSNFIEYLIDQRPKICIHIEPISELLDSSILLDYLSIRYFEKRNYLKGFLTGLKKLEDSGKVIIHKAQRTGIGSLFIEGYSIVVWQPI